MQSIYSLIYSDGESDDNSKVKSADFVTSDSSEAPSASLKKVDTKAHRKVKSSASEEEASSSSSSSVLSSSAMSELSKASSASSASTSTSSAASSSSSGSSSSSSDSEAEKKAETTELVTPKVAAGPDLEKVGTEAEEVSKVTVKKESSEEMDVDVEKEDDEESKKKEVYSSSTDSSDEVDRELPPLKDLVKKPVPMRRASATSLLLSPPPAAQQPGRGKIPEESPPHIIDHCYARPSSESKDASRSKPEEKEQRFQDQFANDHGYTRPRTPPNLKDYQEQQVPLPSLPPAAVPLTPPPAEKSPVAASRTKGGRKASAKAQLQIEHIAKTEVKKYKPRPSKEQFDIVYKFLTKGLDLEDIGYLKRSYQMMLNQTAQDRNLYWLNDTHWVDHTVTDIPSPPKSKRRRKDDFSRPHLTGSCRTEGYYKMDRREKMQTKYHLHRSGESFSPAQLAKLSKAQSLNREARNSQRRQLTVLGDEAQYSELLKFNQLKVRIKIAYVTKNIALTFASSFSSVASR
jgi:hypothetical protein